MTTEAIKLDWKEFQSRAAEAFKSLHGRDDFTDVTLAVGGGKLVKAHKIILSACSSLFKDILVENPNQHPFIFLKGVEIEVLNKILKFIYSGQVEIENDELDKFLIAANDLETI